MRKFEYNDQNISGKQFFIATATIGIGIIILVFQKQLANITVAADGLLSIIFGGMIASLFLWFLTKFAVGLKKQPLFDFTASVVTKPVSIILFLLYTIQFLLLAAYQIRKLTDITQHYLLEETPIEILSLTFLLVIFYAVAGSRVGLFRLNTMFLPFVLVVSLIILFFNIQLIEFENLVPVFKSNARGFIEGTFMIVSILVAGGSGIALFYTSLVESNKSLPKMAFFATWVPASLFLLFYFVAIGVFGNEVTGNLLYASIDLGKTVHVPGGVFERFESIFFVIWIMTVFNLTAMLVDLAVVTMQSIFKNTKKINLLFIFTPIIFFISIFPQNIVETTSLGKGVIYWMFFYPLTVTFVVFVLAKIRGVKAGGS